MQLYEKKQKKQNKQQQQQLPIARIIFLWKKNRS